jgi:hypothetical protein
VRGRPTDAAENRSDPAEAKRELERLRPVFEVRFNKWVKEPIAAVFTIENRGGTPVDRVTARVVVIGEKEHVGFADVLPEVEPESAPRRLDHTFQQLAPGTPQTATFVSLYASSARPRRQVRVDVPCRGRRMGPVVRGQAAPTGPMILVGHPH